MIRELRLFFAGVLINWLLTIIPGGRYRLAFAAAIIPYCEWCVKETEKEQHARSRR